MTTKKMELAIEHFSPILENIPNLTTLTSPLSQWYETIKEFNRRIALIKDGNEFFICIIMPSMKYVKVGYDIDLNAAELKYDLLKNEWKNE